MHKYDKRSQGRDCTASEYQDPQCNCRAYPWNGKKKRQIRIIRHTKKAEARTLDFV